MKSENWFHGLWKGALAVIVGAAATGLLHTAFPACPLDVCGSGGLIATFTTWSGFANVGVKSA